MKVIVVKAFGAPEVMQIAELPMLQPGPGQVLVRVHAAGVNPVDTYIRAGTYARLPTLPYTPGLDGAGVVAEVGKNVKRLAAGDRVYFSGSLSGAYAEFSLCNEAQTQLLPDNVSFAQGAAVGTPYVTAYRALFQRAKVVSGETVLVHGATGGVGLAAVQLANARRLRVLGTGGSEKGRQLACEQGAREVFDHHAGNYLDKIFKATGGKGVDVILEMLANVNLARDLSLLAKNGRVIVIGSRGKIEIDPRETMLRDADIRGMIAFNASEAELAEIHQALVAGLKEGVLCPVVRREFPLADAAPAHKAILEPGAMGKIVLIP